MRREEKLAGAAAQELLKAAAARERRGRGCAAAARKGKGGAAVAPQQTRSCRPSPEQTGTGGPASPASFAAPSATSFTDGSCFFNGTGSYFNSGGSFFSGGGAGNSPIPQPMMHNRSSDPATWDNDPIPSGGFTNFIQPQLSQNFHFVGAPSHYAPFKPPQQLNLETPPSEEETSMGNNHTINVESSDELPRMEKRILWTQEEDVRLMSSWLHNSTDPSIGADRKNEQYWYDVAETYNETTPSQRKRNAKQAKDRWHKVNKLTDLFHNAWLKARRIYTSGHSDQMWIDKAHAFYIEDNKLLKLGHFVLMDVWYTVRNEAKWITYNKGLKEQRKRKSSDNDKEAEEIGHDDVEELEDLLRPMGQKKAKAAARDRKANTKDSESDIEELNKFGKIQAEEHANRLKVLEVQEKITSEKTEQAKLAHLAAKEQKEAAQVQREARKLEVEAKMFETYNRLLSVDVALLSDEEKVEHANIMKCLKKKLFAT